MNINPKTWAVVALDRIPEPHPLGPEPAKESAYFRWQRTHRHLSDFHRYKFSPPPRD